MIRWIVTLVCLGVAAGMLGWSAYVGADSNLGTILGNLGTELVGIVITVAVVEWFFERRRHQTRGRQLAWDSLHAIEHAVWVWQGGPREMDTDEVLGILNAVGTEDPLPDFTEGLFLNIGTRSRRLLNNDPEAVSAMRGFMDGLEHLARLSALRDGKVPMGSQKVGDILEQGTTALAKSLGKNTERHLASLIRYRDPSVQSQERRHFGGRGAMTWPVSEQAGS